MSSAVDRSKLPMSSPRSCSRTFMSRSRRPSSRPRCALVGELGGFTYYSWVFSAFLLAQSTRRYLWPAFRHLRRKPVLIAGIAIFLVGFAALRFRLVDGVADRLRLVQGIGAGAIQP